MSDMSQPDHDFTVHALNIQGNFLERWCQQVIQDADGWRLVATEYPVAYQRPNSISPPGERVLDVRAYFGPTSSYLSSYKALTLLIECKKNNPEFIEWIFFPARASSTFFPYVEIKSTQTNINDPEIELRYLQVSHNLTVADDAWETRGNYGEYKRRLEDQRRSTQGVTKIAKNAVSDAARQIALATQGIVVEGADPMNCMRFNPTSDPLVDMKLFVPTIVTSARLFKCEFDPKDINGSTGEIPYDRVKLTPVPYLIYRYALPHHLQRDFKFSLKDSILYGSPEVFMYMYIFVVHSIEFEGFLKRIPTMMSGILK